MAGFSRETNRKAEINFGADLKKDEPARFRRAQMEKEGVQVGDQLCGVNARMVRSFDADGLALELRKRRAHRGWGLGWGVGGWGVGAGLGCGRVRDGAGVGGGWFELVELWDGRPSILTFQRELKTERGAPSA